MAPRIKIQKVDVGVTFWPWNWSALENMYGLPLKFVKVFLNHSVYEYRHNEGPSSLPAVSRVQFSFEEKIRQVWTKDTKTDTPSPYIAWDNLFFTREKFHDRNRNRYCDVFTNRIQVPLNQAAGSNAYQERLLYLEYIITNMFTRYYNQ